MAFEFWVAVDGGFVRKILDISSAFVNNNLTHGFDVILSPCHVIDYEASTEILPSLSEVIRPSGASDHVLTTTNKSIES